MSNSLKRVNVMIREEQALMLASQGINVSGLVRDLIDDHLSEHKITLSVSEETRLLYSKVVANTGSTDADIEVYLKKSLHQLLKEKIQSMIQLEGEIFKD
jgi:ABC-type Zn2+ transport system substrate-binding protein/surface adhesin